MTSASPSANPIISTNNHIFSDYDYATTVTGSSIKLYMAMIYQRQ